MQKVSDPLGRRKYKRMYNTLTEAQAYVAVVLNCSTGETPPADNLPPPHNCPPLMINVTLELRNHTWHMICPFHGILGVEGTYVDEEYYCP